MFDIACGGGGGGFIIVAMRGGSSFLHPVTIINNIAIHKHSIRLELFTIVNLVLSLISIALKFRDFSFHDQHMLFKYFTN